MKLLNVATITSLIIIVIGLLIAIGPQPGGPFSVCDSKIMKMDCYWLSKAELVIGAGVAVLGIFSLIISLFEKSREVSVGLAIGVIVLSIVAAVVAVSLGICDNEAMHCHDHLLTAPLGITLLAVISVLVSITQIFYLRKIEKV